jgi:hypothetical protein
MRFIIQTSIWQCSGYRVILPGLHRGQLPPVVGHNLHKSIFTISSPLHQYFSAITSESLIFHHHRSPASISA